MERLDCPRCARKVDRLVRFYYKPIEHPGFCVWCVADAVVKFDVEGWPDMPEHPWWAHSGEVADDPSDDPDDGSEEHPEVPPDE